VGMGGVGSVAAEMLTRCGIGKLLMYGALWPEPHTSPVVQELPSSAMLVHAAIR
jgi:hypothetical protein